MPYHHATTQPRSQLVGLQVPGLFKAGRDKALKERAISLLDQWRVLIKEAYRLGPNIPVSQKVRPGFEAIAPGLKEAYRKFFFLVARTPRAARRLANRRMGYTARPVHRSIRTMAPAGASRPATTRDRHASAAIGQHLPAAEARPVLGGLGARMGLEPGHRTWCRCRRARRSVVAME